LIVVNGAEVDFDYGVMNDAEIEVYPPEYNLRSPDKTTTSPYNQRLCHGWALGKLTRNLRLLGFDVAYDDRLMTTSCSMYDRENGASDTDRLANHAVVRTVTARDPGS